MKTEMLLSRANSTRVKIIIELLVGYDKPQYKTFVQTCEARKRTFRQIDITDNYIYRKLPFNSAEREAMYLDELLKHVTVQEIHAAKIQLWKLIEPNI